jgi:hypothetical protein
MAPRTLCWIDAFGCGVSAIVAAVVGAWPLALFLGAAAIAIVALSAVSTTALPSVLVLLAAVNAVWAIAALAGILTGVLEDRAAVLFGLTIPWCGALAVLQWRTAGAARSVSYSPAK